MRRSELAELSAFATVAEERSFTRAASRIGISQSALSHSMRGLEKRFGIQLLARTTRSVSPTAAGTALLQELAPALERIERAVAEARKQRENPAGRIRLIIPRTATQMVILPKLLDSIAPIRKSSWRSLHPTTLSTWSPVSMTQVSSLASLSSGT